MVPRPEDRLNPKRERLCSRILPCFLQPGRPCATLPPPPHKGSPHAGGRQDGERSGPLLGWEKEPCSEDSDALEVSRAPE